MGYVFPRDFNSPPWLADFSANELIIQTDRPEDHHFDDLSAGAGITCLGHSNDAIKQAMHDQIYQLPYVHAMNWTTLPAEALAQNLLKLVTQGTTNSKFNGGLVIFLNTGAEAVEAACKLAMQVTYEQGRSTILFGREHSYHGNTLFTLALGDHPKKEHYPLAEHIPVRRFGAYHNQHGALGYLKVDLGSLPKKAQQGIVVIEPVGGTTIGIQPSSKEYLEMLSRICSQTNSILIYDEVLCGNYRTGELFAYQYYKVPEPDIICLGKGLTGGYFPLSAVIVSRHLVEIIKNGSGKLWHSTTNQNHPLGCAAGIAALGEYQKIKSDLPKFGDDLQQMVAEIFKGLPVSCTGVGSLLGLRLDPNKHGLHLAVRKEALKHGIAVYTDGGTIHGKGNMVLLAPPYTYMEDMPHLEECLVRLSNVIQQVNG